MSKFAEILERARASIAYLTEEVVLQFTYDIGRFMQDREMSQAELAKKIGASPAYISKILRGDGNLTLKTVVTLADAVDARVALQLVDKKSPLADIGWTSAGFVSFPQMIASIAANESPEWSKAA